MFLLYLVFRDEIENLLFNISDFEKGARNKTINSRGRARILDANSRETFRDREFSPMSDYTEHVLRKMIVAKAPKKWVLRAMQYIKHKTYCSTNICFRSMSTSVVTYEENVFTNLVDICQIHLT